MIILFYSKMGLDTSCKLHEVSGTIFEGKMKIMTLFELECRGKEKLYISPDKGNSEKK